jgi:hypothetical protein
MIYVSSVKALASYASSTKYWPRTVCSDTDDSDTSVKSDKKRPTLVSKETYTSVKRDLHSVKRDLH